MHTKWETLEMSEWRRLLQFENYYPFNGTI